jgi:hypothetical protein
VASEKLVQKPSPGAGYGDNNEFADTKYGYAG